MSNTICIKHGVNAPSNNILQPYELGYVTSTGTLVIGNSNKEAKNLNYLQIDNKGYIPFDSELVFNSNANTPRIWIRTDKTGVKTSYGVDTSTGQAHIIQYTPDYNFYEKYSFPTPIAKSASNSYTILSTRGGTYKGNFTLSGNITVGGKLTANGTIIVDADSYGYKDPNTAGPDGGALSGEVGQLYFVIAG